ncbi:MAG TPA: hypothetical protein PK986_10890, partial [Spirochaetota bacterium]|nr:hypothetical protein [Spirochaetota bacterium]
QEKKGLIVIYLVKGKEYKKERFQELIDQLTRIFGEPVKIEVKIVKSIPDPGRVKRKAIESKVKR